jgi:hypothetical protein
MGERLQMGIKLILKIKFLQILAQVFAVCYFADMFLDIVRDKIQEKKSK